MAAFYKRCDEVFVPSASMASTLYDDGILGKPARRWSRGIDHEYFSPNCRDMEWRRACRIADNEILVSFVGRLVREKGLCKFADMMDDLKGRGCPVKALIVGEGPERQSMERRLPEAVFTGHLSGSDLSRAYASSDIFVNPSLTETFGNVTLEAMASGIASICVQATGSADLVKNGETGLLVDQADGVILADAVERLIIDGQQRGQLANAARLASYKYDWDAILAEVLEGYLGVLAGTQPARHFKGSLAA